jgi:hypothetical protein
MKTDYTREELIEICKDAVVHHTKWGNRDSYSAQLGIKDVYKGLTAGLPFIIDDDSNDRTIWIEFIQPVDLAILENGENLEISSREDYFKDCDPEYESEMFDGRGIEFESTYTITYMPTRKRLEECGIGNDWY